MSEYFLPLNKVSQNDIAIVGGKNASLGEMIQHLSGAGIRVPHGFATTTTTFRKFLAQNGLDRKIYSLLNNTPIEDTLSLAQAGQQIRDWIMQTPFPDDIEQSLRQACQSLMNEYDDSISFAVRSSATAEDLPSASFAGQQET
ncbi:MAG: phosphoenolpyruvate synthase, partial [Gammaproteobacteria bacterium]|nr:phosphoenolpyruvate synthase [Gammaproteobacteria bacterium]